MIIVTGDASRVDPRRQQMDLLASEARLGLTNDGFSSRYTSAWKISPALPYQDERGG